MSYSLDRRRFPVRSVCNCVPRHASASWGRTQGWVTRQSLFQEAEAEVVAEAPSMQMLWVNMVADQIAGSVPWAHQLGSASHAQCGDAGADNGISIGRSNGRTMAASLDFCDGSLVPWLLEGDCTLCDKQNDGSYGDSQDLSN